MTNLVYKKEYASFLPEVKERIRSAQSVLIPAWQQRNLLQITEFSQPYSEFYLTFSEYGVYFNYE